MKTKNRFATFSAALAAIIASTGSRIANFGSGFRKPFGGATPSKRFRDRSTESDWHGNQQSGKDDDMPRGFSGAKLARKEKQGKVAVKHHGLRADGKEHIAFSQ